ncbi:hypothetical protein PO860_10225 [Rhizobium sp. BJ04]|uniref:hypothetical protein n=1 Tax=Rhizobium binxianense TaxID=3024242 RepID=UPI0023A9CA23|nr:hypothetical protein [Rhizobium sp. BJ04]WEA62202.1 hypothetical protein PO860_10225 [Rhizobium sp. BJ04]
MANEKETHQPSRMVGYGIAVIMNALDAEGNIAVAPDGDTYSADVATGILPARRRACCPRDDGHSVRVG